MKKTLAAFGTTVLGLGLVGAGAAAPAAAADTTEPCADMNAQVEATGSLTDNWYQDCVPQYGLGKAEFSIVADEDDPTATFPEGFVPLDELAPEAVSTTGDLARQQTYFGGAPIGTPYGAPVSVVQQNASDDSRQSYFASVVAPVTSIGTAPIATLPASVADACLTDEVDYAGSWVATFAPVDTTYSQTIDGELWNYRITSAPLPTYFFGTVGDPFVPWCATDGVRTFDWQSSPISQEQIFAMVFNNLIDFEAGTPEEAFVSLGVFGRYFAPAPIVPAATLPATGAEVLPLAVAAGSFTAFGLALLGFVTFAQRRRSRV